MFQNTSYRKILNKKSGPGLFAWFSTYLCNRVNLTEFLLLNESDLINIGVEKVGLRKKILDVIADMHKRQWEKSSVPKITPRDKQNGIFLSAPDGALLIASVGQHLKLLNANVEFLARYDILGCGVLIQDVLFVHLSRH